MSDAIKNLSNLDFAETIRGARVPVLVDFWAAWCGPCKAIAPVLEELATELQGKVQIAKVDVDAHGDIAQEYAIQAIPTLLLFKDGQLVDRVIGLVNKAGLKQRLAPLL